MLRLRAAIDLSCPVVDRHLAEQGPHVGDGIGHPVRQVDQADHEADEISGVVERYGQDKRGSTKRTVINMADMCLALAPGPVENCA